MFICYGISNGPQGRVPPVDHDDLRWLWRAPIGGVIAAESKDHLVLEVPEFDTTKSTPVWIRLRRKGVEMSLVEFFGNSWNLLGKPELVWGEWRE